MGVARKFAVTAVVALGCWQPAALAAWSGFERPVGRLCTVGSPLPARRAAVVISGRFEMGLGRGNPKYSLVFTANDGTPEITRLNVAVDETEVGQYDVAAHVPATSGASAVVTLDPEMLGKLFHATDTGKVLLIRTSPERPSYGFDLGGFAAAADVFTRCMLRNAP